MRRSHATSARYLLGVAGLPPGPRQFAVLLAHRSHRPTCFHILALFPRSRRFNRPDGGSLPERGPTARSPRRSPLQHVKLGPEQPFGLVLTIDPVSGMPPAMATRSGSVRILIVICDTTSFLFRRVFFMTFSFAMTRSMRRCTCSASRHRDRAGVARAGGGGLAPSGLRTPRRRAGPARWPPPRAGIHRVHWSTRASCDRLVRLLEGRTSIVVAFFQHGVAG
jgi:hypothetical protein